jgi:hypothetical protein
MEEKPQRYGIFAWAEWGFAVIDQKREKMREIGYYWVRLKNYPQDWTVAEFQGASWLITGCEMGWKDEDFIEVGEMVECPYQ